MIILAAGVLSISGRGTTSSVVMEPLRTTRSSVTSIAVRSSALLTRNTTQGPAGEEWDEDYDGPEKEGARWGNPRADGISLACTDSIVDGNVSEIGGLNCSVSHTANLT